MRVFLFALISFALCARSVFGQPQISVSGSAEVKVVPDEIYLYLGIETRAPDLQEAKQENDHHISAALAFLKANRVADKDVKTDFITIQPVYSRDDGQVYMDPNTGLPAASGSKVGPATKPLYYLVRKSIGIKLTDVGSFDGILSGLITNGVNYVQGVDFRSSELRKYRDKARAMAVQAAKEKAQAMASELGLKLGRANSLSENDWGGTLNWPRYQGGFGRGAGGGGGGFQNVSTAQNNSGAEGEEGTISAGQISVSATVNVSFLIE